MFLGHPDPLVRGTDPISDPSIYHQAKIVLSFLMTKASFAQWRILLAYYEREASLEAPGKNLECSLFHSYIPVIRHIAGLLQCRLQCS